MPMYSTKYIRSILPILANAAFFAVVYLLVQHYFQAPWLESLVILIFLLTVIPFSVLPVEYEVYTKWEETFLKFWKTQHFQKEIKRRSMLFGVIPVGKEETVRVERTLKQPPIDVVLNDLLGNAELLVPVVNSAARLLAGRRLR
jgi:hypothetical protein